VVSDLQPKLGNDTLVIDCEAFFSELANLGARRTGISFHVYPANAGPRPEVGEYEKGREQVPEVVENLTTRTYGSDAHQSPQYKDDTASFHDCPILLEGGSVGAGKNPAAKSGVV
jgi:hypothetical protein